MSNVYTCTSRASEVERVQRAALPPTAVLQLTHNSWLPACEWPALLHWLEFYSNWLPRTLKLPVRSPLFSTYKYSQLRDISDRVNSLICFRLQWQTPPWCSLGSTPREGTAARCWGLQGEAPLSAPSHLTARRRRRLSRALRRPRRKKTVHILVEFN